MTRTKDRRTTKRKNSARAADIPLRMGIDPTPIGTNTDPDFIDFLSDSGFNGDVG